MKAPVAINVVGLRCSSLVAIVIEVGDHNDFNHCVDVADLEPRGAEKLVPGIKSL